MNSGKWLRRFLLFLTLTLTLTLSVRSDDFFKVKDRVIAEAKWKLGFLYLTPLMVLQNVGYTSSIYTYQEEEHPDWTGDIGLGLRTSAIAANRFILEAEDLPIYSFYLKNKEYRTWSNRFEASVYSYAGSFNIKGVSGSMIFTSARSSNSVDPITTVKISGRPKSTSASEAAFS